MNQDITSKTVAEEGENKDDRDEDVEKLNGDCYSLIIVSPSVTRTFFFSLFIILLKIAFYTILLQPVGLEYDFLRLASPRDVWTARFLLIPVAVATQQDLVSAYYFFTNIRIDDDNVRKIAPHATKAKCIFSYVLRSADGMISLILNYLIMMQTNNVLAIFLNFAALQFLQGIDDVFFDLMEQGFFGDHMEVDCKLVKKVKFAKLDKNHWAHRMTVILFIITCLPMYAYWIYAIVTYGIGKEQLTQNAE